MAASPECDRTSRHANKAAAFAVDSAIFMIPPYGAVIGLSWGLSSNLIYSGYVDNPAVDGMVGTAGATAVTLFTIYFTSISFWVVVNPSVSAFAKYIPLAASVAFQERLYMPASL